jgi:hypothetical protein
MSIITEDGTGLATAETYSSVSFADTYFSDRGNSAWGALTTAVKEASLRKSTEYMLQVYRNRWIGSRYTTVQALDWPRWGVAVDGGQTVIDTDEIPVEVKRACVELAYRASTATLYADQERSVISESVGPLSVEYDQYSSQAIKYKAIDAMLSIYFSSASGQFEVVRR